MSKKIKIPNTFIDENGVVTFINVIRMTPEDIGHIAECAEYCRIAEKHWGTQDVDEMMRKGIGERAMYRYIASRHDLISWGYKPEDWKG